MWSAPNPTYDWTHVSDQNENCWVGAQRFPKLIASSYNMTHFYSGVGHNFVAALSTGFPNVHRSTEDPKF